MTTPLSASTGGIRLSVPFSRLDLCAAVGFAMDPQLRDQRPIFDEDIWDFHCVLGLPHAMKTGEKVLDFTTIASPELRLLAKEYIAALLHPRHEAVAVLPHASRASLTILTCHQRLFQLKRWLTWLEQQRAITDLSEVSQEDCDAYLLWSHHRRDRHGNPVAPTAADYRQQVVAVVKEVGFYTDLFTSVGYQPGFIPWPGRSAQKVAGKGSRRENRTPPVRQEMLQPLLAAAFYVVEHLTPHILALSEIEDARERAEDSLREAMQEAGLTTQPQRMSAIISRYVDQGEPLPSTSEEQVQRRIDTDGWDPDDPLLRVSAKQLGREAGIPYPKARELLDRHWPQLVQAVSRVGVEHPVARGAALVPRADGAGEVPWTLPLPAHNKYEWLIERVRTACLIILGAVTGMRMTEIAELPIDCRLPPQQLGNEFLRYRLKSKKIKGQPHGGTWDEWVIIQEADHVLGVLRQLLPDAERRTHLLSKGSLNLGYRVDSFRSWVNGPDGQRLSLTPLPGDPVTFRMLRRTLALELAHRPGGLLAAKVHLKHVSVATTEGYANRPGGSQSRFLAEIGEQEQVRNRDLTLTAFRDYQSGVLPSGPGARDLAEFFAFVDQQLTDTAAGGVNVVGTDREVVNLLSKRAKTLYLGAANYCWFIDPAKALCLKLAGTTKADKPLAGMCDSARCPQATHHPCHRPVWADSRDRNKAFITSIGRGRSAERARLQIEADRADRVIAEIDSAATNLEGPADEPAQRHRPRRQRSRDQSGDGPASARGDPARRQMRPQDPGHHGRGQPHRLLPQG